MAPECPGLPADRRLPAARQLPGRAGAGRHVEVNAPQGIPFESDCFRGVFLLLFSPQPRPGKDLAHLYKHSGKEGRFFELRIQGVFTRQPGDVFFAGEVKDDIGLGWAMHLTLLWLMRVVTAMVAASGGWFYFNPDTAHWPGGKTERPHLVWRLDYADTVIATPLGETPPPIDEGFPDTLASPQRGQGLDTEHTYTFVFHSDVVDFCRWELCNLPFGWTSPLDSFIGNQLVQLSIYRLPLAEDTSSITHAEADKEYLLRLEVSRPNAVERHDLADEIVKAKIEAKTGAVAAAAAARAESGARRRGAAAAARCWAGAARLLGPWCR